MEDFITKDLEKEKPTNLQTSLLQHVKTRVDFSARRMARYYANWDRNDEVYRGKMRSDEKDKRAHERGEPTKMAIPWTYAQIETFIAFNMGLLLQRRAVFELRGFNTQGSRAAYVAEALLQRDFRHNIGSQLLYQFFLDIGRFGLAIIKTSWHREEGWQWVHDKQEERLVDNRLVRPAETRLRKEQMVTYLGNKFTNVSPYRFFPDVRVPMTRFQEGEFCASEDTYTKIELARWEQAGLVAGTKHIPEFNAPDFRARPSNRFDNSVFPDGKVDRKDIGNSVVVTECQIDIIPSQFMIDEQTKLGPEDTPVRYLVWYANDSRLIRAEPLSYPHGQFTYNVGQMSPDQEADLNNALADTIHFLQDVSTWLVNSRITSVRKVIQNQVLVDQQAVELKDFADRKTVIRMKKEASGRPLNTVMTQFKLQDVTGSHIADTQYIQQIMQTISGINENISGQFSPGRRSAQENRTVNTQAASRIRFHAKLLYDTAFEPMARQALANLQEGLDVPTYIKLLGTSPEALGGIEDFLLVSRADLVGDYDFEIFDGTLSSEKNDLASTLQELVLGFLQAPEAIIATGYDVPKLIDEILILKGIRNPSRFKVVEQAPINNVIEQSTNGTGVPTEGGGVQQPGQTFAAGGVGQLLQ